MAVKTNMGDMSNGPSSGRSGKIGQAMAALDRADADTRNWVLRNMRMGGSTGNLVQVGDVWLDAGEALQLANAYQDQRPSDIEFVGTQMYAPEEKGYRGYMAEAMRDPSQMSRWLQAQRGIATIDRSRMGGQAKANVAQQELASQKAMAARGGLTGGAQERAAQNRATTFAGLMNQSNEQFNRDMLGAGAQDEERRLDMLGRGAGMELDRARYVQQARENEALRKNAFNASKYASQMEAWGAGRTADAQEKAAAEAGKK